MNSHPVTASLWWHDTVSDDVLAAFHDASADLYNAGPWHHVPDERCRLFASATNLGPRTDLVIVTGQDGAVPGLRLFADIPAHLMWLDRDGESAARVGALLPLHAALEFVPEARVSDDVRAAVNEKGWRNSGEKVWPIARMFLPDGTTDALHDGGLATIEAIVRALTVTLADPNPWQRAWRDGTEIEARVTITTSIEDKLDMEVTTRTPASMMMFEGSDEELLAAFEQLDWSGGLDGVDQDRLAELERTLIYRILTDAPALIPPRQHAGIGLMLDYCAGEFGIPITRLSATELEEIMFEIVPHVVAAQPTEAGLVLDTLGGTLRWLSDRRPFAHDDALFSLLNCADSEERLAELLANAELFSPHKRQFMAGLEAGFDMNTDEGHEAYMEQWRKDKIASWSAGDIGLSNQAHGIGPAKNLSPAQRKKRKSKRKLTRKARKKNR